MATDFIFFIAIAAICFSGLLYTLHSLGALRCLCMCLVSSDFGPSGRQVECQEHRLVNGSDMVWKHLPEFRAGREFPPGVRPYPDDLLRRPVEHVAVD